MKEVKTPKKPLLYYYIVALLVLLPVSYTHLTLPTTSRV